MHAPFTPTAEQDEALRLFATGRNLALEAGAGTGKTSTLKLLAASTDRRGQYIAFNKAIVVEAGAKMPPNVKCSTAHSLAFQAVGKRYAHRLQSNRMKSTELAWRLGVEQIVLDLGDGEKKTLFASYLAGLVMRTVTRFCQSADLEPETRHVPYIDGIDDIVDGKRTYANNEVVRRAIMPAVKRAWADLLDTKGQLPYRHDHYLKTWHLSDPKIAADFILFDECQDANPVLLAIVEAQEHAQRVYVGDSQQAIYGFTGAVNALERIKETGAEVAYLTQSFRFGPAVADVANGILAELNAELRITGTESVPSVVEAIPAPNVILTRTNAAAVRAVLGAVQQGVKVHLVGGGQEIASFARAAQQLQDGQRTGHPDLACFDTWGEVQDYVEHDEQGSELRLLVTLVDEFGIDTILEALDGASPENRAQLVVSTAHKSKGREWDAVQLASDFPEDRAKAGPDEMRLLYVAVTRARLRLDISQVVLLDPDAAPNTDAEKAAPAASPAPTAASRTERVAQAAPARKVPQEPTEPLAEGRRVLEGEIVSDKWDDRGYGHKMLVRLDDGCRVYGSVPFALEGDEFERGRRVRLVGTVQRSRDDQHFGFFSRPTGAELVEEATV